MNLYLTNFIRNNDNWCELLEQSPYNLKIKFKDNYAIFNYNQLTSDFTKEIVKESRGIIIDLNTLKPVCFPFIKFFNIEEKNAAKIDWESAKVQEKIDGSLIKLYALPTNCGYKWIFSTNSMFNAEESPLQDSTSKYSNFYKLIEDSFDWEKIYKNLNPYYTYMFEIVSPYNKVVVNYDKIKIYHIGTRDNYTYEEKNIDIGIEKPKEYYFSTKEEIIDSVNNMDLNHEGYVVVDKYFNRVKVKSPNWLRAHYLSNNNKLVENKIIEIIKANEIDEFCSYFPEKKDIILEYKQKYDNYKLNIFKIYNEIKEIRIDWKDRKTFANWVFENYKKDSDICFSIYDKKINENNINEVLINIDNDKIIRRLKND